MQRAFKNHFPDYEREAAERLQRALILEADEALNPDDPTLAVRLQGILNEMVDSVKPVKMAGAGNIPDLIREVYRNNLTDLQFEGLPVSHETTAMDFWHYLTRAEQKYKKK